MKTPEEIAAERLAAYAGQGDFETMTYTAEGMRVFAAHVIKADREQRPVTRFVLISEHDDAGIISSFDTHDAAEADARSRMDADEADQWSDYYSIREV